MAKARIGEGKFLYSGSSYIEYDFGRGKVKIKQGSNPKTWYTQNGQEIHDLSGKCFLEVANYLGYTTWAKNTKPSECLAFFYWKIYIVL